jgi:hypothetical protein
MTSATPRIGFDRFIDLNWLIAALRVREGNVGVDQLGQLLDQAALGVAARKKTRTVLNRLWLEPRPDLAAFAGRGIEIFRDTSDASATTLSWGMAIAAYPFFGQVAELVGRLSSLQGDCTSAEIHRRMSEVYGEREGTYRMTNMVLQSQANWGVIKRMDHGKRLVRCEVLKVTDERLAEWLVEAVLRFINKPLSATSIRSMPVIFPIALPPALAFIASRSSFLELRSEGPGSQLIALRSAF